MSAADTPPRIISKQGWRRLLRPPNTTWPHSATSPSPVWYGNRIRRSLLTWNDYHHLVWMVLFHRLMMRVSESACVSICKFPRWIYRERCVSFSVYEHPGEESNPLLGSTVLKHEVDSDSGDCLCFQADGRAHRAALAGLFLTGHSSRHLHRD